MTVTIDCSLTMPAIHEQLAMALSFPAWYGRNLDALHDCLTGMTQDITLELIHWERLPGLKRVLEDCAQENPHLNLLIR